MPLITPVWTDTGTTIVAPQCLARGNNLRATFDMRLKYGCRVHIGIGRGGIAALTAPGVSVICRAIPNNGAIRNAQPYFQFSTSSPASAAVLKLVNNLPGYVAGTTVFAVDNAGNSALEDIDCMWGVTAIPANATALPTMEFGRVSAFTAATAITWDAPTLFTHADNEIIVSRAECGQFELPGGQVYELIFDYLPHAAGDSAAIAAWLQTYDSNSAA
jgi:hypothetical protein